MEKKKFKLKLCKRANDNRTRKTAYKKKTKQKKNLKQFNSKRKKKIFCSLENSWVKKTCWKFIYIFFFPWFFTQTRVNLKKHPRATTNKHRMNELNFLTHIHFNFGALTNFLYKCSLYSVVYFYLFYFFF